MRKILMISVTVAALASCSKDKDPLIIVPPSSGSKITLNGGNGGASAENSVYVDFSGDKQTSVLRSSWDLGFYCGSDFRVIINNTTAATAKVLSKNDLNTVGTTDTVGLKMVILSQGGSTAADFALLDDLDGNIAKTAIPEISATATSNNVVIVNPVSEPTSGGISGKNYMKIRVLRNGNGYTLQYAKLGDATYQSVNIDKDDKYNFKYFSFDKGVVSVEPEKSSWDIMWTFSLYKTPYINGDIPYAFSDMVSQNYLNNTQVFMREYSSAEIAVDAYNKFNKDSIALYTFLNQKWAIGTGWRRTAAPGATNPAGVYKTKFYIVKDAAGNFYKLKFLSFTEEDGGTRGKPEIQYELIK